MQTSGVKCLKISYALCLDIFISGCATQQKPKLMHLGVANMQPPYDYSEEWRKNLEFIERQDKLAKIYGSALSKRLEKILADQQTSTGFRCKFSVALIPGGQIVHTDFSECEFNRAMQEKMDNVLIGEALPYSGFESVFRRIHHLEVCAPKSLCSQ